MKLPTEFLDDVDSIIQSRHKCFLTVSTALHEPIQGNTRFITFGVLAMTTHKYEIYGMAIQANQYLKLHSNSKLPSRHFRKNFPSLQIADIGILCQILVW